MLLPGRLSRSFAPGLSERRPCSSRRWLAAAHPPGMARLLRHCAMFCLDRRPGFSGKSSCPFSQSKGLALFPTARAVTGSLAVAPAGRVCYQSQSVTATKMPRTALFLLPDPVFRALHPTVLMRPRDDPGRGERAGCLASASVVDAQTAAVAAERERAPVRFPLHSPSP